MLQPAYPFLLFLLPLPWLLRFFLPAHRETRAALNIPFLDRLQSLTGRQASSGAVIPTPTLLQRVLIGLCWVCILTALSRPQWIEDPIENTVPSRDLLLAIDLSGSMETKDFTNSEGKTVDRLTAAKQVLDDFLKRRQGDRVGMVFFGSAAFVQLPFTQDLDVCRSLLDEAQVRMAGPRTVLGDAMGLAITIFERSDVQDRVLIVLTDGNDTGSKVPPRKAAEIAKDNGVVVYCIAVGDPTTTGEEKLDEETLRGIATTTGGVYFHANNRDELAEIYRRIDKLKPKKVETVSHRPKRDLFHWPLAVFVAVSLLYHALVAVRHRRAGSAEAPTHA